MGKRVQQQPRPVEYPDWIEHPPMDHYLRLVDHGDPLDWYRAYLIYTRDVREWCHRNRVSVREVPRIGFGPWRPRG